MKTITLLATFAFTIAIYGAQAQNDEHWDSKTYELDDFTQLYLEGAYKVFLAQGKTNSLTVKASDDEVFDYLNVDNNSDLLHLKIERDHFNFDRINLYLTFTELQKVKIEGGVTLNTKGYIDMQDFFIHVEGGAKIELDLKARNIEVIGEGGVLFELDGIAETLDVKVSGAGHVDAKELKTRDVTFKIEGVGTGSVYAEETLYAKIEGVGKLKYRGNPKVTKHIEGLGSVVKD